MIMRIISWNVCGWKSISQRGFIRKILDYDADIICLQETRTEKIDLPLEFTFSGYKAYVNSSRRRGFHGTAVITKLKPLRIMRKIGHPRFDLEGRFLRLDFPNFILINIYLPHGGRRKEEMNYKLEAYNTLLNYLAKLTGFNVILTGDFNVAHKPIDLARPKENVNNTMFTLAERLKIDALIKLGFIDTFRKFHKNGGSLHLVASCL
ncbi:MAG: exodeoxyribonuclease III [archaeon GB-1867-035]|nr:exodeoxyribonuclease III [Candidatus Culexmicrobium profundum]